MIEDVVNVPDECQHSIHPVGHECLAVEVGLDVRVGIERISLRVVGGDLFNHRARAGGESVPHAAGNDDDVVGLLDLLRSIGREDDFAVQNVIGFILLLVVLLGALSAPGA